MNDAAQQSLALWVPAPVLVGLVLALFGLVVAGAVMLLNRGFVSVEAFSRTAGTTHEKINALAERVAILEDRSKR